MKMKKMGVLIAIALLSGGLVLGEVEKAGAADVCKEFSGVINCNLQSGGTTEYYGFTESKSAGWWCTGSKGDCEGGIDVDYKFCSGSYEIYEIRCGPGSHNCDDESGSADCNAESVTLVTCAPYSCNNGIKYLGGITGTCGGGTGAATEAQCKTAYESRGLSAGCGFSATGNCHSDCCLSPSTCVEGVCKPPDEDCVCSDGTDCENCSTTNLGKYCDSSGNLENACGSQGCSCPPGTICDATNNICENDDCPSADNTVFNLKFNKGSYDVDDTIVLNAFYDLGDIEICLYGPDGSGGTELKGNDFASAEATAEVVVTADEAGKWIGYYDTPGNCASSSSCEVSVFVNSESIPPPASCDYPKADCDDNGLCESCPDDFYVCCSGTTANCCEVINDCQLGSCQSDMGSGDMDCMCGTYLMTEDDIDNGNGWCCAAANSVFVDKVACDSACGAGPGAETDCDDGIDNDGDGFTDCDDSDCAADSACTSGPGPTCTADGSSCTTNADCCSGICDIMGGTNVCIATSGGAPVCTTGGLIPCGRNCDDLNTTGWRENDPCTLCHLVLMGQLIIEFLVKMAAIFAIFALVGGGLIYVFSIGSAGTIEKAKTVIKYALLGFIVIFIAWAVIGTILATMGYIDPLGGEWHMMDC